jgi:hypothetical protein
VTGPAAVVVPHPPLLVPELTGPGAPDAAALRAACAAAVRDLLDGGSGDLLLIGPGSVTRRHDEGSWGSLAGYGVAIDAPARVAARFRTDSGRSSGPSLPPSLPLSLTIGCYLLDRTGVLDQTDAGLPAVLQEVAVDAEPQDCARLGAELDGRYPGSRWLVLADGTTKRTARAPGAFDPSAQGFDDEVASALADGSPDRLLALDARRAAVLGVAGRSAWQVLAGAWRAAGHPPTVARVDYHQAPYGVGYLVARWS